MRKKQGVMVRKRVPRTHNSGTWTAGQYRSFIKSGLRRMSQRWGPKYVCKKEARHPVKLANERGRMVFHSICAGCGHIYPETTCAVDHIKPVIDPAVGFVGWDEVIARLFCETDNLQVLCTECHNKKTKEEKEIDKQRRRK